MSRLQDKVAVITGAAGGIGLATAQLFEAEGAHVVGVDLKEHSVGELSLQVDITDEQAVKDLYQQARDKFGKVDVLFNNAGISPTDDDSILVTEYDAWQRVQDANLKSVFFCCKYGIPHLLETGGGSIINTASFVAIMGAATSQISYTASKGGVLAMSRELGVDQQRRAGQRHLPGPDLDPAADGTVCQRPGARRAPPGPRADGPLRRTDRNREGRAVPGQRRFLVHDRLLAAG
jgi:NAD(P)-dependent dehydrogenase (short-subunit alcohol dehydrogenase family)